MITTMMIINVPRAIPILVGVVGNKIEAYKKVLNLEYEKNESIDLKTVDKFYEKWRDCRNTTLGMFSSGYRAYVQECELTLTT
jgi:hypothetical protein